MLQYKEADNHKKKGDIKGITVGKKRIMRLLCADYYTLLSETKDDIQRYFHLHFKK